MYVEKSPIPRSKQTPDVASSAGLAVRPCLLYNFSCASYKFWRICFFFFFLKFGAFRGFRIFFSYYIISVSKHIFAGSPELRTNQNWLYIRWSCFQQVHLELQRKDIEWDSKIGPDLDKKWCHLFSQWNLMRSLKVEWTTMCYCIFAQISTSARALLANLAVAVLITTKIMSAFVVKDSAEKTVNSVRWKQLSFTHLQLFRMTASVHQLLLIRPEEAKWTEGCFPCPLFPSPPPPLHPLLKTSPCKLKTHKKLSCQIMKKTKFLTGTRAQPSWLASQCCQRMLQCTLNSWKRKPGLVRPKVWLTMLLTWIDSSLAKLKDNKFYRWFIWSTMQIAFIWQ